jgi:hypothetical protein
VRITKEVALHLLKPLHLNGERDGDTIIKAATCLADAIGAQLTCKESGRTRVLNSGWFKLLPRDGSIYTDFNIEFPLHESVSEIDIIKVILIKPEISETDRKFLIEFIRKSFIKIGVGTIELVEFIRHAHPDIYEESVKD